MRLATRYMGLNLATPIVASASPLNADLDNIRRLEDCRAGAVVLPSIFEEQIEAETRRFERLVMVGADSGPEASSYFPPPEPYKIGPDRYLELIRRARDAVQMPVIASLNGSHDDSWTAYARELEQAGASAIELNIYLLPTDIGLSGADIEARHLSILRAVKGAVAVPVAVKVSPYFSSIGHMGAGLSAAGADALVLFNRFYQPEIDLAQLTLRSDLNLSSRHEIRLPLLWIAILHGRIGASLAATTGVETADEVIKYLLAGADVVMTTSALLRHGVGHMATLVAGLEAWLDAREVGWVATIRGAMSQVRVANPEAFERANYLKVLQGYDGHAQR